MSKKSLRIFLILVTVLSLISTFSFATDDTPLLVSTNEKVSDEVDGETSEEVVLTTGEEAEDGVVSEDTTGEDVANSDSEAADLNEDVYKIATDVEISETVNGNVYVIANNVKITGQVGGDLFVIAKDVNIDGGQVYGNVFAITDSFTLNGLIYDLYGLCKTLDVKYDGVTYRDLKVSCDNATLNGVVGKNANLAVGNLLTLKSDCMVYGDLNYSSPNGIKVVNSSDESSDTELTVESLVSGKVNPGNVGIIGYLIALLSVLVFTLVVWLVMTKFTPKFYGKLSNASLKEMLISLLVGLVAPIVIVLASIAVMFTIVGIPVALVVLALYALLISISFSVAAIAIAGKLAEKVSALAKLNNLLAVIISTVVLWLLTLIPYYVGLVFTVLIALLGSGLFLKSLYEKKGKSKPAAKKAE